MSKTHTQPRLSFCTRDWSLENVCADQSSVASNAGKWLLQFPFGPLNLWDFRAGAATSPFLQERLWGRGRGGYPSKLRQQSEAWETQPGWLLGRSGRSNPTSRFTHVLHAKEMGRDVFKIRHLSPTASSSSNSLSYPSLSPLPLRAVSCR